MELLFEMRMGFCMNKKVKILSGKRILGSGLAAVFLSVILCGINWIKATNGFGMWGKPIAGGDCMEWYGFGVRMLTIYPECSIDDPVSSFTYYYFDPNSFWVTALLLFLEVYILVTVIAKLWEKKKLKG